MDSPVHKCNEYDSNSETSIYFSKNNYRLGLLFYDVPCIDLAKNLLGTILVRQLDCGSILKGKIVETECYLGHDDKASHSYNGKKTPRNEPMFMDPGTLYVYQTYGMYYCLNISSHGEGAAVLIRAVEPLIGIDTITKNRLNYHLKRKKLNNLTSEKVLKKQDLCNGPSKLCIGFNIDIESCNKRNLIDFNGMWLEPRLESITDNIIISSTRIGIESAGHESASRLLRFYLLSNDYVSKRDKKREQEKKTL